MVASLNQVKFNNVLAQAHGAQNRRVT